MKEMDGSEPRQRILDAAISLFAKKSFAAVGVREIAAEAGVNIAMISYYFEGKVGILREIMVQFFNSYALVFEGIDDTAKPPQECVLDLIHNIVDFVRKNNELTMVSYNELLLDIPEIAELKTERIITIIKRISGLVRRMGLDPKDNFLIAIVGPSLISTIFTNFRFRPVLQHVFQFRFDDAYYKRYAETIATLFLNGVTGLAEMKKRKERSTK